MIYIHDDYKNLGVSFLDNEQEIIKNSGLLSLGLPDEEKLSLLRENQTLIGSLNAFLNNVEEKLDNLNWGWKIKVEGP